MNKYQKGINLINEGKIEEAYNYFDELFSEDLDDSNALYLKIQTMEMLEKDPNTILYEYNYLLKIMKEYNNEIYYNIAVIHNKLANYDLAIKYAKKGISGDDPISIRCHYMLAVAYYFKNQDSYVKESIKEIDICIENTDDIQELEFYYSLKIDSMSYLKLYDELEQLINELYFKINKLEIIKKLEGKILINRASDELSKDEAYGRTFLVQAVKVFEDYLQIKPDDYELIKHLYNINLDLENYSAAKSILERLKSLNVISEKEIIEEELFLTDKLIGIDGVKEKYQELEQIYPNNWHVPYFTTYYLDKYCNNEEDYRALLPYAIKAYQLDQNEKTLDILIMTNYFLKKYSENVEIMEDYLKNKEETGNYNHLLANVYHFANYPYDEIIEKERRSYDMGGCGFIDYIFSVDNILEKPTLYIPIFNKICKRKIGYLNEYQIRRMIIKLTYGQNIGKINYKLALKLIDEQEKGDYALSCLYSIKGQIYERYLKDYSEAYKYYQKSYELFLQDKDCDKCSCSISYLAHSYLNGIGAEIDEAKAINLITDALKTYGDDTNGNIIYLYAYLFLNDKINVDYQEVLRLLCLNKAFNRYEITREILIEQVCQKVNIKNVYAVEGLSKALKYDSILAKKYYKKNKKAKYYYPFLNSY